MPDTRSGVTQYGFKWGPMEVARLTSHFGPHWLSVDTGHRQLEIRVSPKGQSITVWLDGRQLK